MTTAQAQLQSSRTEAFFVAKLEAKPTEELRRFMEGPWTASILSFDAIEELYRELQRRANGTEKDFVEMGLD